MPDYSVSEARLAETVQWLLEHGPATPAQLSEGMGWSKGSSTVAMAAAQQQGLLERVGSKRGPSYVARHPKTGETMVVRALTESEWALIQEHRAKG